jgi:hypothetical protein
MLAILPLVDASVGFVHRSLPPSAGGAAVGGYDSQPQQYALAAATPASPPRSTTKQWPVAMRAVFGASLRA